MMTHDDSKVMEILEAISNPVPETWSITKRKGEDAIRKSLVRQATHIVQTEGLDAYAATAICASRMGLGVQDAGVIFDAAEDLETQITWKRSA